MRCVHSLGDCQSGYLTELEAEMSEVIAQPVNIEDVNIPFWHLVGLLMKVAMAAVPATVLLAVVWSILLLGLFFVVTTLGLTLASLQGVFAPW